MKTISVLFLIFSAINFHCLAQDDLKDVYAWCIVPFDSKERSPEERIAMLKDLGISTYAYDWREKHVPEMVDEFNLARENKITINAVWMWIDPKLDAVNKLSPNNEKLFEAIKKSNLKTTLWMSFSPDYLKGLADAEAIEKAANMVFYLYQRCQELGCKIALYNHGDWFGHPANQIKIIKQLGRYDIGLVYNFHHAHHQMEAFEKIARQMVPYLVAVNLNGMKRGGPKIYPLGQGEDENKMIEVLIDAGFHGPFGILGHKEDADVEIILKENLEGYRKLISQ
ncbi:MAG: TIM barrel protein [Saprospiraceae bacterium]|nr:TIM barrel protein [Saprospiraceae bacterium]